MPGQDKNKPCFGCEDRHMGCHSTCEIGLAQEAKRDAKRAARAKYYISEDYFTRKKLIFSHVRNEMRKKGVKF